MAKKRRTHNEKQSKTASNDQKTNVHPAQSFQSLLLSQGVLDYVRSQNFTRMTPVQAATIPQLFLHHKDVAVQAVTGSGKTLAFLIPIVELLLKKQFKKQQIGALVLSPTRELAQQTHKVAQGLCAACHMAEPLLLVGGSSSSSSATTYRPVTDDLKRFQTTHSDIVIGTPGRVQDVLTKYAVLDCSDLECLVLDEADVLLNMGFSQTIQQILAKLPKMRRTGLFSATTSNNTMMHSSLKDLMQRCGMRNPVWIDVAVTTKQQQQQQDTETEANQQKTKSIPPQQQQQATPATLTNYYLVTPLDEKLSRLVAFLQDHRAEKMIVFFLTCASVDFYGSALQQQQLLLPNIELLHGKMVQKRREKAMERFRASSCTKDNDNGGGGSGGGVLFCTDVAARGLDVTDVQWVVQFDAPQDPAFYIHRVGRSARAGRQGASLLFLTPKEEAYVELLQMRKVPLSALPQTERCCPPPPAAEMDSIIDNKSRSTRSKQSVDKESRTIRSASNSDPLEDVLSKVRNLVLKDRDLLEKGTKAFTSYIRAYKEHHCSFIFRFASLDLGLLATSFCLLRLPKMPELRDVLQKHNSRLPHFVPAGPEVDIFAIPFRDKAREKARQKRLEQELASGGKNAKLIKAEMRQAERERRAKERREAAISKGRNPDKKRGRQAQMVDEWDDLAKEERLYKKLRKGKITQEEFDEQMFGTS